MDRELISAIAHRRHPVAAPLSTAGVGALVDAAAVRPGDRVLDLGCGAGAWLVHLLEQHPGATGVGVDTSATALAAAGESGRQLGDRATWVQADATAWRGGTFDVVLCIGAGHVFGGPGGTLEAVRGHLAPGGRVVLGDAVWERPPSPRALDALGPGAEAIPDPAGLLAVCREHGLVPSFGHLSTAAEWDDYEWSWSGSLTRWALAEATDPEDRRVALGIADEHRTGWLEGYRGELGFLTVVLHDVAPG